MVGFIGALSSSLCILILVFITLLLSYINSMLPSSSLFKINASTERLPIKTYFLSVEIKDEVKDIISKLSENETTRPNTIMVGCTYGFDIGESTANNISIFNAIKINSFNLDLNIKVLKDPIYKKDVLNYCFVDFIKEEDDNG